MSFNQAAGVLASCTLCLHQPY